MNIRLATSDDILAILELWNQSGLSIKPIGRDKPENLAKQMAKSNMWMFVAENSKQIMGVVLVTHDSRKGWINRLAVIPSKTKQGIATQLLRTAENSLIEKGIEVFAALITDDNVPSRKLFEEENYQYHKTITYYSKRLSTES